MRLSLLILSVFVFTELHAKRISNDAYPLKDPYFATVFAATFNAKDKSIYGRGDENSALLLNRQGQVVKYGFWGHRNKSAPLVVIIPGLGGSFKNSFISGFAEFLLEQGYSVASISSTFNATFYKTSAQSKVPGVTAQDVQEVRTVLRSVMTDLKKRYQLESSRKVLMGYSLGGYHALVAAAHETEYDDPSIKFDRYIALCTPTSLVFGMKALDSFYNVSAHWSEEKVDDVIGSVAASFVGEASLGDGLASLQQEEAKFLIGLSYRLSLRDLIWNIEEKQNIGIIKTPATKYRRNERLREVSKLGFEDYLNLYVKPEFLRREALKAKSGIGGSLLSLPVKFVDEESLVQWLPVLANNPKVRVIQAEDDPVVTPGDADLLEETFGERIQLFKYGGHMGLWPTPYGEQALKSALN